MLDLLGNAWQREAGRLAQWTLERLVNRTDVYGSYLPLSSRRAGQSNNYTAPANKEHRLPGTLTTEIIEEHYRGNDHGQLIGLHAISRRMHLQMVSRRYRPARREPGGTR